MLHLSSVCFIPADDLREKGREMNVRLPRLLQALGEIRTPPDLLSLMTEIDFEYLRESSECKRSFPMTRRTSTVGKTRELVDVACGSPVPHCTNL